MGLRTFENYADMEANLQPGETGFLGGSELWLWEEGELTETSVSDHPDVEDLGQLYCDDEELDAGSLFDTIGPLRRIGNVYFASSHDGNWNEVFEAPSLEKALDWLAPAMGVDMQLMGYTRQADPTEGSDAVTVHEDPEEHPDFERIGTVHAIAIEDDWVDVDGTDFLLFHVGRIGDVYLERDTDSSSWVELGSWPSLEAFMGDYPEPGQELRS